MQLSIVILNYNTRALLARCLQSVRRFAAQAETIVVDNASSDGSTDLVKQEFAWAQLLANDSNLGFGRAMNRGLGQARGDLMFALNADTELLPDTCATLVQAAAAWPRSGILGPAQYQPAAQQPGRTGPHLACAFADPTLAREARRLLLFADTWQARRQLGPWRPHQAPTRSVDWMMGAALLFRRTCWEAVGGFDEAQFMYGEDWDICYRARQAGYQVVFVPEAHLLHHENAAGQAAFGAQRQARVLQGALYFHGKHFGTVGRRRLAWLHVVGGLLRLAGLGLVWPFTARNRSDWEARRASQTEVIHTAWADLEGQSTGPWH